MDLDQGLARASADIVFFEDGTDAEWRTLVAAMQRERVYPGESLFERVSDDRALALLVEGTAFVELREGLAAAEVKAPTVMSEMAFIDGLPRQAQITAKTDCDVLYLNHAAYEQLSAADPELGRRVALAIADLLAARVRTLLDVVSAQVG